MPHISEMNMPCPLDVCDGSGWSARTEPDGEDVMCPCNPEHPDNNSDEV